MKFSESIVEEAALAWLESAGWQVRDGAEIAPGEPAAERDDHGQVVLAQRLRDALARLNIFSDNELEEIATTEDFSVVQSEGKRRVQRKVKHYNLDAIISVGCRVNSRRGLRFCRSTTRTLRRQLAPSARGTT